METELLPGGQKHQEGEMSFCFLNPSRPSLGPIGRSLSHVGGGSVVIRWSLLILMTLFCTPATAHQHLILHWLVSKTISLVHNPEIYTLNICNILARGLERNQLQVNSILIIMKLEE